MSKQSFEGLESCKKKRSARNELFAGLVLAVGLVALGTFVFSESIETLDVKAEELGFEGFSLLPAPFPDYTVPGQEGPLVNFLLGALSVLLVLIATLVVGRILSSSHKSRGVSSA